MPQTAADQAQRTLAMQTLEGARAARSDMATAEIAVRAAVEQAPDDLAVRMGAYKFYFYNHRLEEALPHAGVCLRLAATDLGVAPDWRVVRPGDAAFDTLEKPPRLYLQCLVALGYVHARLGHESEARALLGKVAELDPKDRFGAARLIEIVTTGVVADAPEYGFADTPAL
ncbi:MAG: hypothetical protein JNM13_05890 [Hyphomicrobiaceae bacterium]|nr:hypothetical protein [Hyphomicrobiaceae bacterium]